VPRTHIEDLELTGAELHEDQLRLASGGLRKSTMMSTLDYVNGQLILDVAFD
jgi:hypothetical protein